MIYLLPHSIDRSAEQFPGHDAFRCADRALTYAALLRRTNQLAHLLVEQGVRRGDRVGIFLPRCLETAIAVYGIMKAGAAYVPIDPFTPPARMQFLLNHCEIRHLITHDAKRRTLKPLLEAETPLQCIIGLKRPPVGTSFTTLSWEALEGLPAGFGPDIQVMEQDSAYIMYTSGSTGEPKGIVHTHYSGLSYARLSAHTYSLHHGDRLGNHAPLHFDISTLGYFTGPLIGATTVLVPEAYTKVPASLSRLIQDERLTVWYSVPYALIQLLLRGVLDQRNMQALRWVLFGGEPFPTKHLRELMQQWPQARFSNVYGPAEVNQCTCFHLTDLPTLDEPVPIGDVWDNTEALVVDADDQLVQPGETGELLIRSPTMMRGYWKQPELTRQALYRRTLGPGLEDVFYRTGDLVRQQTDGNYQFLGRIDRQIKARGYRIELDEIESVLSSHEAVEEVGVFAVQKADEPVAIEAALTLKSEHAVSPEVLMRFAHRHLPSYAVPQHIAVVTALPRTATGKIDRRELQRRIGEP